MLTTLMTAVLAQIPPVAPSGDEFSWVLSTLMWIVEQFQHKNYMPAIAMTVMVLVFAFNKFAKDKMKKEHLPLISAAIGVTVACVTNGLALGMGASAKDWASAIVMGLTVGTSASGFWSLFGKWLMDKLSALAAKKA